MQQRHVTKRRHTAMRDRRKNSSRGWRLWPWLVGGWFVGVCLWLFSGSAAAAVDGSTEASSSGDDDPGLTVEGVVSVGSGNSEGKGLVSVVVKSYAEEFSVSVDEAARRLGRIGVLQGLMAEIRELEGSRVAGWGIDHMDVFMAWVWLTGDDPAGAAAAGVAAGHDDLEIRMGAVYSYDDLRAAQDRFDPGSLGDSEEGSRIADMVTFTGLDMVNNRLEIGIDPPTQRRRVRRGAAPVMASDEEFAEEADRLTSVLKGHVDAEFVIADGRGLGDLADFRGGENITNCTAGFAAELRGEYGILQAGHCPGIIRMNGVWFYSSVGWDSKTADAQFHPIPSWQRHRLFDDYKCAKNPVRYCDVTGTTVRENMMGDYICKTGRSSGVSCGSIFSIDYQPRYWGACRASNWVVVVRCDPVFVRVDGPKLAMCSGDSGGPVYNAEGIAYGIVKGGDWTSCSVGAGRVIFSTIDEAEAFLGIKVLTEDPSPPDGTPSNLRLVINDSDQVNLGWEAPADEKVAGYEIYRRVAGSGEDYERIGKSMSTSYVDTAAGLGSGTRYEYSVSAFNNLNLVGAKSDPVVVPVVPGPPPEAPSDLSAVLEGDSVKVTWTGSKGQAGFEVYRRKAVRGHAYEKIGTSKSAEYVDPVAGLTPGAEYYYRVKAVDNRGRSGSWGSGSNYAAIRYSWSPGGLSAVLEGDSVKVSWTAPHGGYVSEYVIYRRVAVKGDAYKRIGYSSGSRYDYRDRAETLIPGAEYYYRVKAVNRSGAEGDWGSGSNYAAITIPAPTGLSAVLEGDSVTLTWTGSKGQAGYEVYRRKAVRGHAYEKIGTSKAAEYVDPVAGLTPGAEYYYRVKAFDSRGRSGSWGSGSNYAAVIFTPVPSGLSAVFDGDSVKVTWTRSKGQAGYEVYRRKAVRGHAYEKIGTSTAAGYVDPVAGLASGAEYYYRVKAVDRRGSVGSWGSQSNYAKVRTPRSR